MIAIKEAETNKDVKNYKSFKKLPDPALQAVE